MDLKQKLLNKMVEDEFTKHSTFGYDEVVTMKTVIDELNWLPDSNVETLLDNYDKLAERSKKSVGVFFSEASKMGLLKFKPFMTDSKVPSLALKYNRFVHLFRGYSFHVSYTEEGIGEYQSASTRVDRLRAHFMDYNLEESRVLKYLYYMNLIQAATGVNEFDKLLKENSGLVDAFMQKATTYLFKEYSVTYEELKCTLAVAPIDAEPLQIYRIPASATMDWARLRVYDKYTVSIEVAEAEQCSKEYFFRLPDPVEGLDTEEYEDFDVTQSALESLVVFAFNSLGFVVNYLVAYPNNEQLSKFKALNSTEVKLFNDLNAI